MKKIIFPFTIVFIFCSCQGLMNEIINPDQVINLKIFDSKDNIEIDSIVGDGLRKITLKVNVPNNAAKSFRKVKITASKEGFIGLSGKETNKEVNGFGIATFEYIVPFAQGKIFFSAEIGSGSDIYIAEKSLELKAVEKLLKLEYFDINKVKPKTVLADGTTIIELRTTVLANTKNVKKIKFELSDGQFLDNGSKIINLVPDDKFEVSTLCRVHNTNNLLNVKVISDPDTQYNLDETIILENAPPEKIFIEPAKLKIALNENINLDAYLNRLIGKVTSGNKVYFEATQLVNGKNVNVGRFQKLITAISGSDEKIPTVIFSTDTGDIDTNQDIIIKCFYNEKVSSSINLKFSK